MIMTAIPFDTLKFARHLEASGLAAPVAAGAAEALADALTGSNLATKADLAAEISGVKGEITVLRSDIAAVRTEIGSVRTELKYDIELLRRDITIKFGSMLVIAVGILLAAIRYLPPHS
jgi:hypothetical protein